MKQRLLIAEKDLELRDTYACYFSKRDFHVTTVGTGYECIEHVTAFLPDVLFLQWELPWSGAGGGVRMLRQVECLACMPIVIASDQALDPFVLQQCTSAHVIACVQKPFRLTTAFHHLQKACPTPQLHGI